MYSDILMEVSFTQEKWPCPYMNDILGLDGHVHIGSNISLTLAHYRRCMHSWVGACELAMQDRANSLLQACQKPSSISGNFVLVLWEQVSNVENNMKFTEILDYTTIHVYLGLFVVICYNQWTLKVYSP